MRLTLYKTPILWLYICIFHGISVSAKTQQKCHMACEHKHNMCVWEWVVHVCIDSYCVRSALQQEIDGSVYIFVAVMQGYHALILSLPSYLNQLWKMQPSVRPTSDTMRLPMSKNLGSYAGHNTLPFWPCLQSLHHFCRRSFGLNESVLLWPGKQNSVRNNTTGTHTVPGLIDFKQYIRPQDTGFHQLV